MRSVGRTGHLDCGGGLNRAATASAGAVWPRDPDRTPDRSRVPTRSVRPRPSRIRRRDTWRCPALAPNSGVAPKLVLDQPATPGPARDWLGAGLTGDLSRRDEETSFADQNSPLCPWRPAFHRRSPARPAPPVLRQTGMRQGQPPHGTKEMAAEKRRHGLPPKGP